MIHTISNAEIQLRVKQEGAEICSIKSIKSGKEFIWEGIPEIWGSQAPVLFPVIGALKNNTYQYNDKIYSLPKHGFIRHNQELKVKRFANERLVFNYRYTPETLKIYPFQFDFSISFQLMGNKIVVLHKVTNLGQDEMLFSLGGHPAFKCPINHDENLEDCYLEFEKNETASTYELTATGLVTQKTNQILNKTDTLPITKDLFLNDALIFKKLKSKKVSLKSLKSDEAVIVRFNDFNYLGIWAKPGAPFVCIEPWLGIADSENADGDFKNKEGLIKLLPREHFMAQYSVEIEE